MPHDSIPDFRTTLDDVGFKNTKLLEHFLLAILATTTIYSFIYFYLGIFFSSICLAVGSMTLFPICFYGYRRGNKNFARLVFVTSCNFYVFSASLGLRHEVKAEFFAIPCAMIAVLIFDPSERLCIIYGVLLPVLTWFGIQIPSSILIPDSWSVSTPYASVLGQLNFFGAFIVSIVLFRIFVKSLFSLRNMMLDQAEDKRRSLEAINQELQTNQSMLIEAQSIARLGTWSYDLSSSRMKWSSLLYQVFHRDPFLGEPSLDVFFELIHSEEREQVKAALNACFLTGDEHKVYFRTFQKKNFFWIEMIIRGKRGKQSEAVESLRGTCRDITIERERELESQNLLSSLELALESAKMAAWSLDLQTGEMWRSRNHDFLYGYSSPTNHTWDFDFFLTHLPAEERDAARAEVLKQIGKPFSRIRLKVVKKEAKESSWMEVSFRSIFEKNQKLVRVIGITQDITDSIRMETKLKLLFSSVHAGLWDWDLINNVLIWDESLYNLYQIKPADFSGEFDAWANAVVPEDQARSQKELQDAIEGIKPFDTFFRVRTPSKEIIHIGAKATVERDDQGKAVRMIGINWDASATFSLQQELKKERDHLEMLFEHMHDGVVIQGKGSEIYKFNRAALNILRMNESEILGKTSLDSTWRAIQEDGSPFPGELHPASVTLRTGQSVSNQLMGVHVSQKDLIWLMASSVPTKKNAQGLTEEVLVTFSDVSAIKKAQENFKQVFDYAPVGIVQMNSDFNILDANPNFLHLLHYSKEEVKMKNFFDLCVQEGNSLGADQFLKFSQVPAHAFEVKFKTRDEKIVWGRVSSQSITEAGETSNFRILALIEDITQMKILEESLDAERAKTIQNAKLASLGEMAAGVAHEINNPLSVISAALFMLKKDAQDKTFSEEQGLKRAVLIERSVERIKKIVTGLRKFSRVTAPNDFARVPMNALLQDTIEMTHPKTRMNDVVLEISCETKRDVKGNEIELQQVLVNLIHNAVDAIKTGLDRWIKVKAFDEGDEIVIQVINSGEKMSDEVIEKLFHPFFTTKPVGEGTGLGLSISKGILESHDGTLSLNEKMPNTCFEIRLKSLE